MLVVQTRTQVPRIPAQVRTRVRAAVRMLRKWIQGKDNGGESMSNENYIPFGDEWEKAVMKLTKATLVKLYKKVCIEKLKLEDKLEKMS